MKKLLAILLGACLLLGVMTGCGGNAEDAVTVQKVSDITSQGSVGLVNRYAGIVVSGETATVKKGDKKVLETYVKEGDFVTEGDVLFCYDNEAMELQLSKLLLELEGYENTISNAEEDIPNLERQRDAAPAAQQLTYSLQIQELQANVREATYNKGLKEREIENLQEALEDTDVRAPISGRVMSVKNTENTGASSGYDGDTSGSDAYITIMDMTTYQVKGTINELNVGTLSEGMNVLIRSRLDESVTWSGVLDSIDWETKVQSNNSPYYGGGGGNDDGGARHARNRVKIPDKRFERQCGNGEKRCRGNDFRRVFPRADRFFRDGNAACFDKFLQGDFLRRDGNGIKTCRKRGKHADGRNQRVKLSAV